MTLKVITHDLSAMCTGEAQVDAHALLLTCCVAIYMGFPFGMSTAATIRVGNLVGANRPAEARLSGPVLAFQVLLFQIRICISDSALAFVLCTCPSTSTLAFKKVCACLSLCPCPSGSTLASWVLQLLLQSGALAFKSCDCHSGSTLAFQVQSTCLSKGPAFP